MTRSVARAGFTLLEMLTFIVVLTVILGLGMALLLTAMRADQVGAATLNEITRHAELAEQFRADVARSSEAPGHLGEFTAGPACLILRIGDGHVVYRWQNNAFDRTVRKDGKDSRRPIPINAEDATVEFMRPTGDQRVVTVRVTELPPRGLARRIEISAALGGDLR